MVSLLAFAAARSFAFTGFCISGRGFLSDVAAAAHSVAYHLVAQSTLNARVLDYLSRFSVNNNSRRIVSLANSLFCFIDRVTLRFKNPNVFAACVAYSPNVAVWNNM